MVGKAIGHYDVTAEIGKGGMGEVYRARDIAFTNEQTLPLQGFLTFQGYSNYDITPDGRRFMVLVRADQTNAAQPARPQIHIVQNWFEALKRIK